MHSLLPSLIPDMSHVTVLVVGDIMLDRYLFGDTDRVSPEAPVPIVHLKKIDHRPGGAGNVALNIAALGGQVILLGHVGEDEPAEILRNQLDASGVTHDLCAFSSLSTIMKWRIISRKQHMLRLDFEEKNLSQEISPLFDLYKKYISQTQCVILSDYGKGTLNHPPLFIEYAQKLGIPILVDPKGSNFNIYRGASLLTPNFKEFTHIVGPCFTEEEIILKGRQLSQAQNIQALIVTQGENGMTLIEKESTIHFPAYIQDAFDVTGAGDTVISILGASLAAGLSLQSAAELANVGAGIVVGKLGAATTHLSELRNALRHRLPFASKGIIDEAPLISVVQELKACGKKIIFTNGCFDILHAGHVALLQEAKQLGDYLIVAINTDESISQLKGPRRPINPLNQRMSLLASLKMIDWVVSFSDLTPNRLLTLLKPDMLVKGEDYQLHEVVGGDLVKGYGGEVRILHHRITSSTAILEKLTHDNNT